MFRRIFEAAVFSLVVAAATPAAAQDRVQAGVLNCDISGGIGMIIGSQKSVQCTFTPSVPGPAEIYTGTITRLGLDIGITTGANMVWGVFASTSQRFGGLAGEYVGATAEATVAAGLGANVLIGGSNRTVALQPLSIQAQTGLNVAAGVADLSLRRSR